MALDIEPGSSEIPKATSVMSRLKGMLNSVRDAIFGDGRSIEGIIADAEEKAIRERDAKATEAVKSKKRKEQQEDADLQEQFEGHLEHGEKAVKKHVGYKFLVFRDTPLAVRDGKITRLLVTEDTLISNELTFPLADLDKEMQELKSLFGVDLTTTGHEGIDGRDYMGEVTLKTKTLNEAIKSGKITLELSDDGVEMKLL